MAKMIDLVVLVVLLSAAINAQRSDATTYNVGDNSGWYTPPNGAAAYSAWANKYKFVVGDVLVFNFITGQHTVAMVNNPNDYDSCNTRNPVFIQTNSPVSVPLNSAGVYYFFCTIHCSQGQKLTVNVGSTIGPSPLPPPPPGFNFPNPPSPPGFNFPNPFPNPPPPPGFYFSNPPPPPSATTRSTFFSGLIVLPILLVVL